MRIIAKLDIKQSHLIKSIRYDGVRKIGDLKNYLKKYLTFDLDEIVFLNCTGSLYNSKINLNLLNEMNSLCNFPISAGGGIKNLDDASKLIFNGCDKIILNTLIHENLNEAKKIINTFGSASVVGSIQYREKDEIFETYHTMARVKTKYNLRECINFFEESGVGEIILNNIDNDGKISGIDENSKLIKIIQDKRNIPFLINGGFKSFEQIKKYNKIFSGIIISSALHFNKIEYNDIRNFKEFIDENI